MIVTRGLGRALVKTVLVSFGLGKGTSPPIYTGPNGAYIQYVTEQSRTLVWR